MEDEVYVVIYVLYDDCDEPEAKVFRTLKGAKKYVRQELKKRGQRGNFESDDEDDDEIDYELDGSIFRITRQKIN